MKRALSLFLMVLLAACASDVKREFSYNLDVPAERFSAWNYKNVSKEGCVDVEATFIERRRTPKWDPSASFQLVSREDDNFVTLFIVNREQDTYNVFLSRKKREPETKELIYSDPVYFKNTVTYNEKFSLQIKWDSPGKVSVTLNGVETQVVTVDFEVNSLMAVGFSGEIDVEKMIVTEM